MSSQKNMIDNTKIYIQYANDVVNNDIIAGKLIRQSCERFLSWFERDDLYFDYDDVDRKIRFTSKLKHSTGKFVNQPFILLPWQQWIYAGVYGFKYKETNRRVVNNAFIMISRKNGKTALASAMALCGLLVDNEANPEIDFIANSRQQAHIGFDMCNNFSESCDPKKKVFKRYRDSIKTPSNKGTLQVMSSDSMSLDGYNSSVTIIDEFHASKSWDLYNVMQSSMGMREDPLMIIITTAGFLLDDYPCFEYHKVCKDILAGIKADDSIFPAIYQIDDDDDWTNKDIWVKASPSLGITVEKSYMQKQLQMAKNNISLECGIKTKNLNIFCQSNDVWITSELLKKSSQHIDLHQFNIGQSDVITVYGGVDLASVKDFTVFSIMIPYDNKLYFKTWAFLPEDSIESSPNRELYKEWVKQGYLTSTPGNVTDYDIILEKINEVNDIIPIYKISYDNWNATQFSINATNAGLNMSPYSQSLGSFNKPTKEFERLLLSDRIVIDDNPLVRWCFANVKLSTDRNENTKPVKGEGKNMKIDAVISMLECLGGMLEDGDNVCEFFTIDN